GPRSYRFRLMASTDGAWRGKDAALGFELEPLLWQSWQFRAGVVLVGMMAAFGFYRYRVRVGARQFNMLLEERVHERTRIARELHDTLLQSFQGVLLKFSAVRYLITDRPGEAIETLECLVDQARAAVTEGRDAVQGLRSSAVADSDLACAITSF